MESLETYYRKIKKQTILKKYHGSLAETAKQAAYCWCDRHNKERPRLRVNGEREDVDRFLVRYCLGIEDPENYRFKKLCQTKGCYNPYHRKPQRKHVTGRKDLSKLPQYPTVIRYIHLCNDPVRAIKKYGQTFSICKAWSENHEKMIIEVGPPTNKGDWLFPLDPLKPLAKDNSYWGKPESDLSVNEKDLSSDYLTYLNMLLQQEKLKSDEMMHLKRLNNYHVILKKDYDKMEDIVNKHMYQKPQSVQSKTTARDDNLSRMINELVQWNDIEKRAALSSDEIGFLKNLMNDIHNRNPIDEKDKRQLKKIYDENQP